MKRLFFIAAFLLSIGFLFSACQKQGVDGMDGTWSWVEEGEENTGDYVVIEDGTIAFFYGYGDGDGLDEGVKYKLEYEPPHIFIMGINAFDVVSKSRDKMVWEDATTKDKVTLTKRDNNTVKSLTGVWKCTATTTFTFGMPVTVSCKSTIGARTIVIESFEGDGEAETYEYVYNPPYVIMRNNEGVDFKYLVVSISRDAMSWKSYGSLTQTLEYERIK